MEMEVKTSAKREVVDITDRVQQQLKAGAKAVNVFVAHTTCAIATADLDPGTDQDLLDALDKIIPELSYRHPHDPSHRHVMSHLASSVIGPGVTVPVSEGKLVLGSWQRIILVELDGPRWRTVVVSNL